MGAQLQYDVLPKMLVELGYQGSRGLREPIAWSFNQAFLPPTSGNPNNSVSFTSQCPPGSVSRTVFAYPEPRALLQFCRSGNGPGQHRPVDLPCHDLEGGKALCAR